MGLGAILLGGDGRTIETHSHRSTASLALQDQIHGAFDSLWNPAVIASLNFQTDPCIRHALELVRTQGGKVVEMIGEPVYCLIFEIPGKGYFLYSDIVKRFYNQDSSSLVPEAIRHCRHFTTEQRIGVYMDHAGDTDMPVFLLLDFSLRPKPIVINNVPCAYCVTDTSYNIQFFSARYKQT